MNQPPRPRPIPRQRPAATRRPTAPPPAPRRQVPWVSLTIWGLVIGVGAGIYIQINRWINPMFRTPPPPPFLAEAPIGSSSSASSDNSDPEASAGSEDSQTDVAASSAEEAGSTEEAVDSNATASSEVAESTEAIAADSSTNDTTLDAPLEPEPVANTTARGRVIEPIGLAIRADPSVEAAYLGGLAFNETVTILESSGDGRWQRVRRDFNGLEGWIKAGNIEAIE